MKTVRIVGPHSRNKKGAINTTSSSNSWSRGLSPFFLGPVNLYGGRVAKNLENAYQFCKVYAKFLDEKGEILPSYWKWAEDGWRSSWAHRYPQGKGAIPEFSLWNGERLGYIDGRKKIYMPLYQESVKNTDAYKKLKEMFLKGEEIVLFDFDGYDFVMTPYNFNEVLDNPHRKMGHAFVLAKMLLEEVSEKP